jgi:hypothetical protein
MVGVDVPGVLALLGVSPIGEGEVVSGPDNGEGEGSVGKVAASPGDVADGGRDCELATREGWLGRRGGGGAGAWMLTRRLEERDLVESSEDRLCDGSVSSCWITGAALEVTLLSNRPWGWRRGGGAGFLVGCGVAAGGLETACDVFGGVGGLGGMRMLSPGCSSGSGTLPAASRSNTLSVSSSAGDLCGAGGRGLLTSDGVGGLCLDGDRDGIAAALGVGLDNGGRGPLAASSASPAGLGAIRFPCRELGGGGFFFGTEGAGCEGGGEQSSPRRSSSASGSEVSRNV